MFTMKIISQVEIIYEREKKSHSTQEEIKRKRNHGKEYKKYRGKGQIVEEKCAGSPCECPKRCFQLIITEENREKSIYKLLEYELL